MLEALVYLGSAFWLGAVHAATPGHGKTVAAAYLVGARGRTVDAVVLGIFVTLAHTGGIIAFGILATVGSSALLPRQAEGYLALATGLLIVGLGLWMLWTQRQMLPYPRTPRPAPVPTYAHGPSAHDDAAHDHAHADHASDHAHADHAHPSSHDHDGGHQHHGWAGHRHHHGHDLESIASQRPSLGLLLGLGIAGGIMPDPPALAVLLSAVANGKLVLGLLTVLVFSLGFASVLVAVGLVAARAGRIVLDRLGNGRRIEWLQVTASVLVVGVGVYLTIGAWNTLATLTR